VHTFKNTSKHTCSDTLNLNPPAPLYLLQDFMALYEYCIIIIITIIIIIAYFIGNISAKNNKMSSHVSNL